MTAPSPLTPAMLTQLARICDLGSARQAHNIGVRSEALDTLRDELTDAAEEPTLYPYLISETPPKGDVAAGADIREDSGKIGTTALVTSADQVGSPAVPSSPDATGLKPCPFCGETLSVSDETRLCYHPINDCILTGQCLLAVTWPDKISAWNRRAPPSPQVTREGTNNALIHDLREWASQALCATDEGTKILEAAASALTAADERIAEVAAQVESEHRANKQWQEVYQTLRARSETLEASLAERDATIAAYMNKNSDLATGIDRQQTELDAIADDRDGAVIKLQAAEALLETAVRAGIEAAFKAIQINPCSNDITAAMYAIEALAPASILAQIINKK